VLLVVLIRVAGTWGALPTAATPRGEPTAPMAGLTNTEQLGMLIYTKYIYLFQGAGMVLLVAMIGAIVLTLRQREGVKRQRIARQVSRSRAESVVVVKVEPRSGV